MATKSFQELFKNIELNEVVTFLNLFKDDETASMMKQIILTDEVPLKKLKLTDEITVFDSKSKSDSQFIDEIDTNSENIQD